MEKYEQWLPALSRVAKQVFSIPVASSGCKRIFSRMKDLLLGKRAGKSYDKLDMDTFIGSYFRSLRWTIILSQMLSLLLITSYVFKLLFYMICRNGILNFVFLYSISTTLNFKNAVMSE